MNDTKLLPDDPRITAYALGELEGADREAVESALRADPSLRAAIDEIRLTSDRVEAALAREAAMALPTESKVVELFPLQKGAAVRQPGTEETVAAAPADPYSRKARKSAAAYSQFYYIVAGVAAACFAVVVFVTPERTRPVPKTEKVYVEMKSAEPVEKAPQPEKLPVTSSSSATLVTDASPVTPSAVPGRSGGSGGPVDVTTNPTIPVKPEAPTLVVVNKSQPGPAIDPAAAPDAAVATQSLTPSLAPALTLSTPPPGSLDAAPGRPAPGSGEKMYLSPFTISSSRLQKRLGTAPAPTEPVTEVKTDDIVRLDAFEVNEKRDAEAKALTADLGLIASASRHTESYSRLPENEFLRVRQHPSSTFATNTDAVSYGAIRRFLQAKQRPPLEAVRIEELLNYFPYHYPPPSAKSDAPIAAALEVSEAPWAPGHRLVRIGLKAREITTAERAAANLVFLVDVSGSMNAASRLPLVQESLRMLVGKLRTDDRVAIVTYAGNSSLALPSTLVSNTGAILRSLESLKAGGSAHGATGIQLAYDIAKANFVKDGINRVILCTHGDFNAGATSESELAQLVEEKAQSGVFLTVLGYGAGNLKSEKLERLADKGDGNYANIDSRKEAEKVLVQQVNGTLVPIAKDVKIQVEFNPAQVASYRLIGYENRALKKDEFSNDNVDAGEVGAGHTVTALYEVIPVRPVGKAGKNESNVEESRYNYYGGVADYVPKAGDPRGRELLTVKVRYKKPDGIMSRQLDFPLRDAGGTFASATPDFKFAAAVAGFGMILRDSPHKGTATMASVIEWAQAGIDDDVGHYRSDFVELARQADSPEK